MPDSDSYADSYSDSYEINKGSTGTDSNDAELLWTLLECQFIGTDIGVKMGAVAIGIGIGIGVGFNRHMNRSRAVVTHHKAVKHAHSKCVEPLKLDKFRYNISSKMYLSYIFLPNEEWKNLKGCMYHKEG